MARNFDNETDLMAVVGMKGEGKWTLTRQIVRNFPARHKIIFDHKEREYARRPPSAHVCTTFKHCAAALEQTESCVFDPTPMRKKLRAAGEVKRNDKVCAPLEAVFWDFSEKMFQVCEMLEGSKLFVFDEPLKFLPT